MELSDLLNYFNSEWDQIKQIAVERGLPQAFYPIIFPELDDQRYVDRTLPALKRNFESLWKSKITNPSLDNFKGLVLTEKMIEYDSETAIVNVIYVDHGTVYDVQCLKENLDQLSHINRYVLVSLPTPAQIIPEQELHNIYNQLHTPFE